MPWDGWGGGVKRESSEVSAELEAPRAYTVRVLVRDSVTQPRVMGFEGGITGWLVGWIQICPL